MHKARMFLIIGIWVAILPYLGFPHAWKNVLYTLTGLFLAYISFLMHREQKKGAVTEKAYDNFRENSPLRRGDDMARTS